MKKTETVHTETREFETLYNRLSSKLRNFISLRISDKDAAEDILQEVFIKVHANIETVKDVSKIDSWIYQITRNTIIDYYRTKKTGDKLPDEIPDTTEEISTNNARLNSTVKEFIRKLPPLYREALILTEFKGLTQKEVAEKLGISLPGAKSRVQRARKMLKEMLLECCHFELDRYGTVLDYYPHKKTCCPNCG